MIETAEQFQQKVEEYSKVHADFTQLEATKKEMGAEIMAYMKRVGEKKIKLPNGNSLSHQTQDRSVMDEDVVVKILKEKGLQDCITTKEVPDSEGIKKAIFDEKLQMEDLNPALKPNIVEFIRIDKPRTKAPVADPEKIK